MSARPRSYQPGESWHNASLSLEIEAEHGRPVPHPGRECAFRGPRDRSTRVDGVRCCVAQGVQLRPFPPGAQVVPVEAMPPSFIHDGFWSNYQDLEATFKEEWAHPADEPQKAISQAGHLSST